MKDDFNTPNTTKVTNNHNATKNPDAEQLIRDAIRKLGGTAIYNAHKSMNDFKAVRNNNEVDSDIRYLEDRKKDFGGKGWLADQLESISSHGFVDDEWLGNIPGKTGRAPFEVSPVYTAVDSTGNPYDDVVNRIDYAVSIHPTDGQEESIIGFDVTLNNDALTDKLFRTTNDERKSLPFGFSGLDYGYLPDETMLPKMQNIPRYCVTMNLDEETAKNYKHHYDFLMSKEAKTAKTERTMESLNYLKRFNAKARFEVLSEVFAQNELFQAMLPEPNGKDNLVINDAKAKLATIQKMLRPALHQAATRYPIDQSIQAISSGGKVLQKGDREAIDTMEARARILADIKKYNAPGMDPEQKKIRVAKLRKELRVLISDYVKTIDPNYAAMMEEIDRLRALEQAGTLDNQKSIGPRNKTVHI